MIGTAQTFTPQGLTARAVQVEADVHRGLPSFSAVGLPDVAVRELRERVRAALVNCGFEFPLRRVVVNLAPASVRKLGPGLDLAVTVALLRASGQLELLSTDRFAMVGELGLDGSLRPVPGVLPIAEAARERGYKALIVPEENGPEAALVGHEIEIVPLSRLDQVHAVAAGKRVAVAPAPLSLEPRSSEHPLDMADLRGAHQLRQALEVAAAGGHSLLMFGPAGTGKTLAAARMPTILPPLQGEEALEVARIASVSQRLGSEGVTGRPFRAPHHTISPAGLIGGGTPVLPGEVTLAHHGVLFLDNVAEFRRDALEALRGVLDSGRAAVTKGVRRDTFPARFQLLAAANPCPCGCDEDSCNCPPLAMRHYKERILVAFGEPFHLMVDLRPVTGAGIEGPLGESSADIRERVCAARQRQEERLGAGRCNAGMSEKEAGACAMTHSALKILGDACARQAMSPRRYRRIVSVARTIADLEGGERICRGHVAHALGLYRRGERP
jgi:magnesium chelatase family protein